MNITLLSGTHILHEDGEKGAITALVVPLLSKTKRFSDISSPNNANVRERYGDVDDTPALWRVDGPYVDVYGNIPLVLKEKRCAVYAHLPQDFAPENCAAFYYVINEKWIAHGVYTSSDDGRGRWGVSLLDAEAEGVSDTIVSSVSERILDGREELISVAVHNNEDLRLQLGDTLKSFGIDVQKFEDLKIVKKDKPLYFHRDFSLIMLTSAIVIFIAMIASIAMWVLGVVELDKEKKEVRRIQDNIRQMQQNKKLGHVVDPYLILNMMESPIPHLPSSLIHHTGKVGALFGDLSEIEVGDSGSVLLEGRVKKTPTYTMRVTAKNITNSLLVDQERVAKSATERFSWLRSIQRSEAGSLLVVLDMEVQVK